MESPYQTVGRLREKYMSKPTDPVTVCIKVVPDAAPNDDGVWRKVLVDDGTKLRDKSRDGMWPFLSELAGEGNHAVAVTYDLSYDGKPGSYFPKQGGSDG